MSDNQPDENKSREIENQFFQGAKLQIIGGAALVVAGLALIASARAVLDAFSEFLRSFIPRPTDPNEDTYWPIGIQADPDNPSAHIAESASAGGQSPANCKPVLRGNTAKIKLTLANKVKGKPYKVGVAFSVTGPLTLGQVLVNPFSVSPRTVKVDENSVTFHVQVQPGLTADTIVQVYATNPPYLSGGACFEAKK